jgi:hypothetical protein
MPFDAAYLTCPAVVGILTGTTSHVLTPTRHSPSARSPVSNPRSDSHTFCRQTLEDRSAERGSSVDSPGTGALGPGESAVDSEAPLTRIAGLDRSTPGCWEDGMPWQPAAGNAVEANFE